jgi:DNA polymerase III alpha subunit
MSEKRFKTFKSKFDQYKKIYSQNRKHEMFAKWRYESSLLGYSYSHDLRECFKERYPNLQDLKVVSELPEREKFQVAGEVKDFFTRTSQNGNKYMIISLADNTATKNFLFMDTSRGNKLTDFLQYNKLKKTQVIIVNGSKSRDSFFVETIKPIDTDIYMKLREVKSD